MKRIALVILVTLLGDVAAAVPTAERKTGKSPLPEVLVVGDAVAGPEALRPAPGKPVYYAILGGVEKRLGDVVVDVKPPDAASVRRELTKALASQGYVEAREGGPKPEIAILYSWGTANLVTLDADELLPLPPKEASPGELNQELPLGVLQFNRREINQLIGADKAKRHLMSSLDADELNEAYRNDRIYVVVAALDVAAAGRKERRLLWRTRLSIDWRDFQSDSLNLMFTSAAPYFGRDTDRGVFVDDNLRRKAEVILGETRVVEEKEETKK